MASSTFDVNTIPHHKLYISELEEKNGIFDLEGRTVKYIDILGTITKLSTNPKFTLMSVDDNTAIIKCIRFHEKKEVEERLKGDEEKAEEEEEADISDDEKEDFFTFVERVTKGTQRSVRLGDLVNVRGRLGVYKEEWQVVVSSVVLVRDCNIEWFRVREVQAQRKALKSRVKWH